MSDHSQTGDEDVITITNEFTEVKVRKVHTAKGERLEISSPNLGYEIRLDALLLEAISWQETDTTLSEFLETPWGPEH